MSSNAYYAGCFSANFETAKLNYLKSYIIPNHRGQHV
jgi:hypothetical protein